VRASARALGAHLGLCRLYDRALVSDRENYFACFNRAFLLERLGRLPEALDGFREAATLRASDPYATFNMGVVLLRQERPEEAVLAFSDAISRCKAPPPMFLHARSIAYRRSDDFAGAARDAAAFRAEALRVGEDTSHAKVEAAVSKGRKTSALKNVVSVARMWGREFTGSGGGKEDSARANAQPKRSSELIHLLYGQGRGSLKFRNMLASAGAVADGTELTTRGKTVALSIARDARQQRKQAAHTYNLSLGYDHFHRERRRQSVERSEVSAAMFGLRSLPKGMTTMRIVAPAAAVVVGELAVEQVPLSAREPSRVEQHPTVHPPLSAREPSRVEQHPTVHPPLSAREPSRVEQHPSVVVPARPLTTRPAISPSPRSIAAQSTAPSRGTESLATASSEAWTAQSRATAPLLSRYGVVSSVGTSRVLRQRPPEPAPSSQEFPFFEAASPPRPDTVHLGLKPLPVPRQQPSRPVTAVTTGRTPQRAAGGTASGTRPPRGGSTLSESSVEERLPITAWQPTISKSSARKPTKPPQTAPVSRPISRGDMNALTFGYSGGRVFAPYAVRPNELTATSASLIARCARILPKDSLREDRLAARERRREAMRPAHPHEAEPVHTEPSLPEQTLPSMPDSSTEALSVPPEERHTGGFDKKRLMSRRRSELIARMPEHLTQSLGIAQQAAQEKAAQEAFVPRLHRLGQDDISFLVSLTRTVKLFSTLPHTIHEKLCKEFRFLFVPAKKVLFRQGKPSEDRLYILVSGAVDVYMKLGTARKTRNRRVRAAIIAHRWVRAYRSRKMARARGERIPFPLVAGLPRGCGLKEWVSKSTKMDFSGDVTDLPSDAAGRGGDKTVLPGWAGSMIKASTGTYDAKGGSTSLAEEEEHARLRELEKLDQSKETRQPSRAAMAVKASAASGLLDDSDSDAGNDSGSDVPDDEGPSLLKVDTSMDGAVEGWYVPTTAAASGKGVAGYENRLGTLLGSLFTGESFGGEAFVDVDSSDEDDDDETTPRHVLGRELRRPRSLRQVRPRARRDSAYTPFGGRLGVEFKDSETSAMDSETAAARAASGRDASQQEVKDIELRRLRSLREMASERAKSPQQADDVEEQHARFRRVTISTREDTTMLTLSREAFKRVLKSCRKAMVEQVSAFLGRIPIFEALSQRELRALARRVEHRRLRSGQFVVSQGSPVEGMYFLRWGRCSVKQVVKKQLDAAPREAEQPVVHRPPRRPSTLETDDTASAEHPELNPEQENRSRRNSFVDLAIQHLRRRRRRSVESAHRFSLVSAAGVIDNNRMDRGQEIVAETMLAGGAPLTPPATPSARARRTSSGGGMVPATPSSHRGPPSPSLSSSSSREDEVLGTTRVRRRSLQFRAKQESLGRLSVDDIDATDVSGAAHTVPQRPANPPARRKPPPPPPSTAPGRPAPGSDDGSESGSSRTESSGIPARVRRLSQGILGPTIARLKDVKQERVTDEEERKVRILRAARRSVTDLFFAVQQRRKSLSDGPEDALRDVDPDDVSKTTAHIPPAMEAQAELLAREASWRRAGSGSRWGGVGSRAVTEEELRGGVSRAAPPTAEKWIYMSSSVPRLEQTEAPRAEQAARALNATGGASAAGPLLHRDQSEFQAQVPFQTQVGQEASSLSEDTVEKPAAVVTARSGHQTLLHAMLTGGEVDVLELGMLMPGDCFGESVALSSRPALVTKANRAVLQRQARNYLQRGDPIPEDSPLAGLTAREIRAVANHPEERVGLPPSVVEETLAPASVLCETAVEVLVLTRKDVYSSLSFQARQAVREAALSAPTSHAVITPAQRLAWQRYRDKVVETVRAKEIRTDRATLTMRGFR
jgi:hypothetical protein